MKRNVSQDFQISISVALRCIANKVDISNGLLRKLQKCLLRQSLVTRSKSFITSHLDYRDIIFNQLYKKSFHESLKSLQYKISLAITGTIRATSKEKLHKN